MARQYGNVGIIYQMRGDLSRAEEMHEKSLAIELELGHKQGVAQDCGNLGKLYEERGEMGQAVTYWRKSLRFYRENWLSATLRRCGG